MADYEQNVKHPKIPYQGTYPNLHVSQGADGHQIIRSLEPGKESYFEVQPSGSYEGHYQDGTSVSVGVGKSYEYGGDGKSSTIDGHHDAKVSGTMRTNSDGGRSSETAGDQYSGGSGTSINGTNDSAMTHSTGDIFHTSEGNHVTDHTGHVHHNVTGDLVSSVKGNKMEIINGEWGINSQDGNVDIQVDGGKFRLFDVGDILIESTTKITLKVGTSTIVITPSTIEIMAQGGSGRIDINK
jgi:hypothetical protein